MMIEEHKLADLLIALENGARPSGGVASIIDGIPSIGGEHLAPDGGFDFSKLKFIPEEYFLKLRRGHIQEDDILVVKDGATTGKTSFVSKAFPFDKAAVNEHVFILRVDKKKVLPKFLFYFLYSPLGQKRILVNYRGAAIGGINQAFAQNTNIPLPPLAEQERIVCLLDEAESLRKLRSRASNRMEEFVPALFHEMFGNVVENNRHWRQQNLGDVCEIRTGKLNANAAIENGDYPFFTCSREIFRINTFAFDCEAILLSGNNASGDFDVKRYKGKFNAYQRTYVISIKPEYADKIDYQVLQTTLENNLASLKYKSIGGLTKYLTLGMITSIEIPVPPLNLQREFAQHVHQAREIQSRQDESAEKIEALYQSMLSRAFAGEL